MARSKEYLRCAVPQCHDLAETRHELGREETVHATNLMRVCPHGNSERACKAEVTKLEVVISIDQKILRFQVAMEDAMRVTIEQPRRQLVGKFLCSRSAMIRSIVQPVRGLPAGAWRAHIRGDGVT